MKCKIEFSMNNDSFFDDVNSASKRILSEIARKFDIDRITDYDKMKIFDLNGNSIGYIQIIDND